jgi:hypothetical protein
MIKFVLLIRYISEQLDFDSTHTVTVPECELNILREQDTQHNKQ